MDENSNQPDGDQSRRKYVFVGGSPRSGTSLLGRNIARMEDCTGLKNTGVFEDEGQFLQDVYPTASAYGGSSRCGFDPQHAPHGNLGSLSPGKYGEGYTPPGIPIGTTSKASLWKKLRKTS